LGSDVNLVIPTKALGFHIFQLNLGLLDEGFVISYLLTLFVPNLNAWGERENPNENNCQ
jgi:hypothetical protein